MITPEELRLTNLLYWNRHDNELEKEVVSVYNIQRSNIRVNTDIEELSQMLLRYEDIEGIPLTEEWLIKLGGEKNGTSIIKLGAYEFWSNTVQENDYSMRYPTGIYQVNKDVGRYEVLHSIHNSVTNVHQLQNLYFALTGEQLTIK